MKHADHFDVLLRDTVNLARHRLDLLDQRVQSLHNALRTDAQIGHLVGDVIRQGSWAHRTIINPTKGREFDADVLLTMHENPEWSSTPSKYSNQVWAALNRHPTYGKMSPARGCHSISVTYANDCHVDIVPYLHLADGREVIVNRDEDKWEQTNPTGFTEWMKRKDDAANGNLRKVIRLVKFLRDHRGTFTGTKSIILTTLLGERVGELHQFMGDNHYSTLPNALVNIATDLDGWLQQHDSMPPIFDPSATGITFNHRWSEESFQHFRSVFHTYTGKMQDAADESDYDRSLARWQEVFGPSFRAPGQASTNSRFGAAAASPRSGRAG